MSSRLFRSTTAVLAGLACAATAWAAAPAPNGASFRVIQCASCLPNKPRVAGAGAGGFLAVWNGSTSTDPKAVSGRIFTRTATPRGGDLAVAVDPAVNQFDSAVAATKQGAFVVVWSAVNSATGTDMDVWARRYQATGVPIDATPIAVNVDDPALSEAPVDFQPAVAPTSDGGFVVAWMRAIPPYDIDAAHKPHIMARRFNASGVPATAPVKISTGITGSSRPDVCVDASNQAVVAWSSLDNDEPFASSRSGVVARRFSPASVPVGNQITVAAPTSTTSPDPAIGCLAGGIFVVAWQSNQAPAIDVSDILARRFTQLGRAIGTAVRVNTHLSGLQRRPAVSQSSNGKAYVIVWDGDDQAPTPDLVGIYGRSFTSGGVAQGSDFAALEKPRDAATVKAADVAHIGTAGHFVVVWENGTTLLTGRRFKPGS